MFPLLVSPAPPLDAAADSPALGAAADAPAPGAVVAPPALHAASARTLTAARAPTLCRFIQSLLQKSPVVADPALNRGRSQAEPSLLSIQRPRRPSSAIGHGQ